MGEWIVALLLYSVVGSPIDVQELEAEQDCSYAFFDGAYERLVYDGPAFVPFYTGELGSLVRDGNIPMLEGTVLNSHDGRPDRTVYKATVYEITAPCVVQDVTTAGARHGSAVTLGVGDTLVIRENGCFDGQCEAEADGEFLLLNGLECVDSRKKVAAPSTGQIGWWVPQTREGVQGWVKGSIGWHVEAMCYGSGPGADRSKLQWHIPQKIK